MTAGRLASLADVSREHLSAVENGHKVPTEEWVRRVELAMDAYQHETGQDEPTVPTPSASPEAGFIRIEVKGVYGAEALIVQGPPENLPELEAMIDRLMRRRAADQAEHEQG